MLSQTLQLSNFISFYLPGTLTGQDNQQPFADVTVMKATRKFLNRNFIVFGKKEYSTERPFSTTVSILPDVLEQSDEDVGVKPYSAIPGPKELPFVGNAWRFAPVIGKIVKRYRISCLTVSLCFR